MNNKILVLGAGPIIVGQACEFDYSGTQACKTLKEEKYNVVLLNSNPATIMTDYEIANSIYIEQINLFNIINIIIKERPNFILPTMGGQTSLNCILDFINSGFPFPIENILGINKKTLINAESRYFFNNLIKKIGLKCPDSIIIKKHDIKNIKFIEFPCIIRPSFTLGGLGSGIAYNKIQFLKIFKNAFSFSNEITIDKSIIGWKEYEMELLIDKYNNIVVICCIENIDPVGIHTGDSITITPPQTLSDKEYQNIRDCSFIILKSIGLKGGGANIQFAINPANGDVIIIELNPRISRSSALASKATGYPIAKIFTKLSIGYNLINLLNDITYKNLNASFEPLIDYIVIKIPKFNFEKFKNIDYLNTMMKSIGEIMSLGGSFQESFIKSIFSIIENNDILSFLKNKYYLNYKFKIIKKILKPSSKRIFYILDSFRLNFNIKTIFSLSKIDPWFLFYIKEIIDYEKSFFKFIEFSNIIYKKIDSCCNEFVCPTSYLYSSNNYFNEIRFSINKKILIIGSGANRIGQSIEFDYCCTKAAKFIKKIGLDSILINCNPETVSTDYDMSSQLIFDPVNKFYINNIIKYFNPILIIPQLGGQTSLNYLKEIKKNNYLAINNFINKVCSCRNKFNKLLKKVKISTIKSFFSKNINDIIFFSNVLKKPLILRPSCIIGGKNVRIIFDNILLIDYIYIYNKNNFFVFIEKFLENSKEFDIDLIVFHGKILSFFIIEHIENAGIHSGDSMAVYPVFSICKIIIKKIKYFLSLICYKLKINGIVNFQICYKKIIYIIECNPRASRTIPFVSKSSKYPILYNYLSIFLGYNYVYKKFYNNFYFLKESIFSLNKLETSELSPEMKSTGETMSIGLTIQECFIKSQKYLNKIIFFNIKKIFFCIKYLNKAKKIKTNSKIKKILYDIHISSYVSKKKRICCILSNYLKNLPNLSSFTTYPMIKLFLSSLNKNYITIRKINNI
ncbi:carbamoyl-phosphate synthase large subunit [Candidatus Carsonella ruddii]|uniref:Carbamoyl-phosphate synthase large subunit n=1 Tax=Candidatus Carsonella ruddii (Diaphorina cf. continua) TaxID=2661587 RepID=A0A7R6VZE6_CARRU|nr:carbamoyl-phosphate synthase large subunit [Candidatus Carsonella ruddii (Diaphorina cf. continua)]BCG49299.1 carbamoyl-phosphate synthase large subunit [Candidatus Carsonella ruddii (Diaphorina cf. continua)]